MADGFSRARLAAVCATLCVVATAASCGGGSATTAAAGVQRGTFTTRLSPYGFDVETTVRFTDDRRLRSAAFSIAGRSYPAEFYPLDGTDDDAPPRVLPVRAGTMVSVSAKITPVCASPETLPTLVIRSTAGDRRLHSDRYAPSEAEPFEASVRQWCAMAVQASLASSSVRVDGTASVTIRLVNPGEDMVTVTSAPYRSGSTAWQPSSATVAAGGSATMQITGTGVACRSGNVPWLNGKLTSAGAVVPVEGGESWC